MNVWIKCSTAVWSCVMKHFKKNTTNIRIFEVLRDFIKD